MTDPQCDPKIDRELLDQLDLRTEHIGGNIPVYLQECEMRAMSRILLAYPTTLPDDVLSALEKFDKILETL